MIGNDMRLHELESGLKKAAALAARQAARIGELEAKLVLRDRRITVLANACLEARAVFQEYVRHHRAKYPPDTEKADRNVRLADMLGNALTTFPAKTEGSGND